MGLPAHTQTLSGPFSRSEKLMFHVGLFLIGSWNLAIVNLARSPHHLWFWPWVAGWAAALLVHCGIVLYCRFVRPAPTIRSYPALAQAPAGGAPAGVRPSSGVPGRR